MSDEQPNLDPQEVTEQPDYVRPDSDPAGDEITDPSHPDFVKPAEGVTRPGGVLRPEIDPDGGVE